MKKCIYIFILSSFIISCGELKNTAEKPNYTTTVKLVNSKNFEIEQQWLFPLGGNRVNLIGNPNFIKFNKDSVDIYLPYYGVRQMGGGFSSNSGIEFKGIPKELKITPNDSKQKIDIFFKGYQDSELLTFNITVFSNLKTSTSVTSSQRNAISYTGELKALQANEK
ncbi:DUF4251 domain-containing protein [Zhouia sp. PK063]|uniref:DUF4251 domain-containing protein n=1 Tax=Zhouia sp. PK063 TaxID=3373602 RepID=UPI0037A19858